MFLSGRIEGPMVVVVEEFSKLSSCDDSERRKEQVGDHLVANEERIKKETLRNDNHVNRFNENGRYPKGAVSITKSDGRITFYSNSVKNMLLSYSFMII